MFVIFDTRLVLKRECHSKSTVQLKEYSLKAAQSILRALETLLPSFTQNLMEARFLILLYIVEDTKHKVEKALDNACSQCDVTWQTDAIGLRKCDLGLPFHLLPMRQLQQ
jgi:hypothetical protein